MVLDGWLEALVFINIKIRIIKDAILNEWTIFVDRHKTLRERDQYKEKLEIVITHATMGELSDPDLPTVEIAIALMNTQEALVRQGMNTSIEYHYSDGDAL